MSAMVRVKVGYEEGMGISVYVKGNAMHKGGYISHYAVKEAMAVEENASTYDNKKNYTPTLAQLIEKNCMYMYNN